MTRWRLLLVLLSVAAIVVVVNRVVRWAVVGNIALGDQVPQSGLITLHHIHNRGAAFGLFPQLQVVFLVAAVAVGVYILTIGSQAGGVRTQIVLGLILGGAVANAIDRWRDGYVVDYVDVHFWPIFNVADSAIVVGVMLLILFVGRRPRHIKSEHAEQRGSA